MYTAGMSLSFYLYLILLSGRESSGILRHPSGMSSNQYEGSDVHAQEYVGAILIELANANRGPGNTDGDENDERSTMTTTETTTTTSLNIDEDT